MRAGVCASVCIYRKHSWFTQGTPVLRTYNSRDRREHLIERDHRFWGILGWWIER